MQISFRQSDVLYANMLPDVVPKFTQKWDGRYKSKRFARE